MILANTSAPGIIDATANISLDYMRKHTNLCDTVNTFSKEYSLALQWKAARSSPRPLDAFRNYAKAIVLAGPVLDPQTLLEHVDHINNLPVGPLIEREMQEAIQAAQQRRLRPDPNKPAASGQIKDDNGFLADLFDSLQSCNSPCNYFSLISDGMAIISSSMPMNTNKVAPGWDHKFDLFAIPMRIAATTFNKITITSQNTIAGVAGAVENTFRRGLSTLFNAGRITEERECMQRGVGLGTRPHGSYLVTDPYPFFKTQENSTNILSLFRGALGDCFRLHEYLRRFNPSDPNMNVASAPKIEMTIAVAGSSGSYDAWGKSVIPDSKPSNYSIDDRLGTKSKVPVVDDEENWKQNPATGKEGEKPEIEDPNAEEEEEAGGETAPGGNVTDFGQATDPYLDSLTKDGIGAFTGRSDILGGGYLLRDYSMAVSPDVEAQMRAAGINPGSWVSVTLNDGRQFVKRWDDRTANYLTGRVDFYSPIGRAAGLGSGVSRISGLSGPPQGYVQPPRYINSVPQPGTGNSNYGRSSLPTGGGVDIPLSPLLPPLPTNLSTTPLL